MPTTKSHECKGQEWIFISYFGQFKVWMHALFHNYLYDTTHEILHVDIKQNCKNKLVENDDVRDHDLMAQ